MSDAARPLVIPPLHVELDGGLTLRHATPADTEALVAFNMKIHGDPDGGDDLYCGAWVRALMTQPHPTFRPELFTVVEESATGAIVSSLNLIPQIWSYGGIPFGVGRIELVGTHPDYRRRGLVRRQMDVAHEWSAGMGHLVQGITGIPWYYRQFGYEMTLALDGSRRVATHAVPALPAGEPEPFRLRHATLDDLPFIAQVDTHGRQRYLVSCERDAALWAHELTGDRPDVNGIPIGVTLVVIETTPVGDEVARPVGFLAHWPGLAGPTLAVTAWELAPGISWLAVTPSVLRGLRDVGAAYAAAETTVAGQPPAPRCETIAMRFAVDHPAFAAAPDQFRPGAREYAWYLRVADLPAFLHRIAPVLNARLATSAAAGHSGELVLGFYRSGFRLRFDRGKFVGAEPIPPPPHHGDVALLPDLTLLHLLFGHRSLPELEYIFADVQVNGDVPRALLTALFPKLPSLVWPVS